MRNEHVAAHPQVYSSIRQGGQSHTCTTLSGLSPVTPVAAGADAGGVHRPGHAQAAING
jgi:hypothetical protein